MKEKIIIPKQITKENFLKFGDMISTNNIKPIEINNGFAKRFDGIANLNTSMEEGETTISIFSFNNVSNNIFYFINLFTLIIVFLLLYFQLILI